MKKYLMFLPLLLVVYSAGILAQNDDYSDFDASASGEENTHTQSDHTTTGRRDVSEGPSQQRTDFHDPIHVDGNANGDSRGGSSR